MARTIWIFLFLAFAFSSWMIYAYCDKKNLGGIPGKHVITGWKLWQEKNCQSCHQIYGLGGYLGPDLTNVASKNGKGANYMRVFIQNGTGRMPNFHLNDSEINDLIVYLSWVDKSGKTTVTSDAVQWTGTFDIKN